jgi:hypothetical protein
MNPQHKRWLFDLLVTLCPRGKCIAVTDADGVLWSLMRGDKGKHFVASNAFHDPNRLAQASSIASQDDAKHLSKLSPSLLTHLANLVGASLHARSDAQAKSIVSTVNGEEEKFASSSESDGQEDDALKSNLESLNVKELKSRCQDKGISLGRSTKALLIDKLLSAAHISQKQIKRTATQLSSPVTSIVHSHYKDTFNSVDLIDKSYYALQKSQPRVNHWAPKFILALMDFSVVNAHALYHFHHAPIELVPFQQDLALQLYANSVSEMNREREAVDGSKKKDDEKEQKSVEVRNEKRVKVKRVKGKSVGRGRGRGKKK